MTPLGGRGKKPAEPLREGDRGIAVTRALIRPFEVASDAPVNELMETTMTDAAFDAQGPGTADRNPRINAEEGATWRMTVHDSGSWRARRSRARMPQGSMGPVSVSGMAAHWHPSTRG